MAGSVGRASAKSSWRDRQVAYLPPFLVGVAGAAAGEMAAGLLLYSSEGLLRALTVVLVTEMAALGMGFATSRRVRATDVDGLRRRWLVAVFSFAAAAVFAGAWGLSPGSPISPLSQGLGLGLLAALPLFSAGAVLGGLSASGGPGAMLGVIPPGRGSRGGHGPDGTGGIAAPASFGAAAGLLFTGLLGVPSLQPASLYLFCVVTISAGALLHGWMMDRTVRVLPLVHPDADDGEGEVRVGSEEGSPPSERRRSFRGSTGDLRWERRVRTSPRSEIRVLRIEEAVADAGALVRTLSGGEGGGEAELRPCLPWQRHVLDMVEDYAGSLEGGGLRVLVVGVGTGALFSALERGGHAALHGYDPRGHGVGEVGAADQGNEVDREGWVEGRKDVPLAAARVASSWSELLDAAPPDGYDVVVVNLRLLPRNGAFHELDLDLLRKILGVRRSGGIALVGGLSVDDDDVLRRSLEWLSDRCGGAASLFHPRAGTWSWAEEPWDDLLRSLGDVGGGLLTCRPERREGWIDGPEERRT